MRFFAFFSHCRHFEFVCTNVFSHLWTRDALLVCVCVCECVGCIISVMGAFVSRLFLFLCYSFFLVQHRHFVVRFCFLFGVCVIWMKTEWKRAQKSLDLCCTVYESFYRRCKRMQRLCRSAIDCGIDSKIYTDIHFNGSKLLWVVAFYLACLVWLGYAREMREFML